MKKKSSTEWLKYSGVGIQMAATVIICLFLGEWVGKYFNYERVGMLVGVFFGLFASIYNLFKQIQN